MELWILHSQILYLSTACMSVAVKWLRDACMSIRRGANRCIEFDRGGVWGVSFGGSLLFMEDTELHIVPRMTNTQRLRHWHPSVLLQLDEW